MQVPPCVNDQFGWWTVIGEPSWPKGRMVVLCRCKCGTERQVLVQSLRRKDRDNPSCGCWRRQRTATIVTETRWKDSHGRSKDPLYQLWLRINKRCYNPKAHNYRWYGARGITVCDEWRHNAGAFIAYIERELGPRPPGMSLDRIRNDGNYEPGNVQWADALHQARNRRTRTGC
jgi:hypothetical protein